jgi:hypothetical protein
MFARPHPAALFRKVLPRQHTAVFRMPPFGNSLNPRAARNAPRIAPQNIPPMEIATLPPTPRAPGSLISTPRLRVIPPGAQNKLQLNQALGLKSEILRKKEKGCLRSPLYWQEILLLT